MSDEMSQNFTVNSNNLLSLLDTYQQYLSSIGYVLTQTLSNVWYFSNMKTGSDNRCIVVHNNGEVHLYGKFDFSEKNSIKSNLLVLSE